MIIVKRIGSLAVCFGLCVINDSLFQCSLSTESLFFTLSPSRLSLPLAHSLAFLNVS